MVRVLSPSIFHSQPSDDHRFPTPFFSHYLILHVTLSLSVLLYGSASTYTAVILITLTYSNISSFLFSLLCSKLTHSNFQVQEAVRVLISAGETKVQSTQQKWNLYVPKKPSVRMRSYASIAKPPKHRCGEAVLLVLRRCAMLVELGTGRRRVRLDQIKRLKNNLRHRRRLRVHPRARQALLRARMRMQG